MKVNKIKIAFDEITLTDEQKNRMLQNILKDKKASPIALWTKRLSIPVAAALVFAVLIPVIYSMNNKTLWNHQQAEGEDFAMETLKTSQTNPAALSSPQNETITENGSVIDDEIGVDSAVNKNENHIMAGVIWNTVSYTNTQIIIKDFSIIGKKLGTVLTDKNQESNVYEYLIDDEISDTSIVVYVDDVYYLFEISTEE